MKLLHTIDRASGKLANQLLSSTTSGDFDVGTLATLLGTQDWDTPAGEQAVLTIEDEQILCTLAESGGTLTATIVARGYNGTTAATHDADTDVYVQMTSAHYEIIKDDLNSFTKGIIKIDLPPTITSATVLTVAGNDVTALYTPGRVVLIKISSTWHRCVVRSSSFSTDTTINVSSDTLPSSGTVADCGFSITGADIALGVDYFLVKQATNLPASNPPSGYSWLVNKGGDWYSIDSSGNKRFLTAVKSTAASSGGALTLDWSAAKVYVVALTENITGVTHSNGVAWNSYILIFKQHASSAKTVVLGTGGGTRFPDDIPAYVMTTTTSKKDRLTFQYDGDDTKFDLCGVVKGF